MGESYVNFFREVGVDNYYAAKEKVIPEIAREIRSAIEKGFYEKWKNGDISITELQTISKLIIEKMSDIREDLEIGAQEERKNFDACNEDRQINVKEWSNLGILQRMVGAGARRYAEHQELLTDYYT